MSFLLLRPYDLMFIAIIHDTIISELKNPYRSSDGLYPHNFRVILNRPSTRHQLKWNKDTPDTTDMSLFINQFSEKNFVSKFEDIPCVYPDINYLKDIDDDESYLFTRDHSYIRSVITDRPVPNRDLLEKIFDPIYQEVTLRRELKKYLSSGYTATYNPYRYKRHPTDQSFISIPQYLLFKPE
jgi:hypothetical protein